jgi:3-hydroxyisobutyrate dehydrogenase
MRIGFIGLGAMGRHMAANLQRAGHEVQAHDLRRVDGFPNWKTSAAEAARGCDVVFTSLPGPKEVQALAPEISSALVKDASWFDLSTNSPEVVRRLHRELPKIHFLDAPVSGGPSGAESGKLAIWVGGDEEIFKRFKPVLEDIGDQPLYIGPIGAGTVAKLAHNCASFAIQAVLAEIFTLGVKGGVEPLALFQALRQGASGRKRTFDRLADFYLPGRFDPAAFSLKLAHKDATLALELAEAIGVALRLGRIALEELAEGMRRGWAERDCRAAMLLQEERAGVAARVSPERMPDALKD